MYPSRPDSIGTGGVGGFMEIKTEITKFNYRGEKDIELEVYAWDEILANHVRINGVFYEDETLSYIRTNFPCQKTILDVGANIGNHTTFLAEFMNAERIHAFEPHPMNFELLQRNMEKYPHVTLHDYALGETIKRMSIETELGNMGNVKVLDDNSNGEIKMFPLDAFDFQDVTLIKIDVEGYEWGVLQGAIETIRRWQPVLVVETLNILETYRIIRFLSFNFGYVVKNMLDDWNLVFFIP